MVGDILNRDELHKTYGGEIKPEHFYGHNIMGQIFDGWKLDNICIANINGRLALKNKSYKEHN